MNSLFFIILGGLILTVGDVSMKQWVVDSSRWYYLGGAATILEF